MKTSTHQKGFSLVEVALALGVASFSLVAIFGLLPAGVNSIQTSVEKAAAANLATRLATDLQATLPASTETPIFSIPMSGDTTIYLREDGTVGNDASDARYRARVVTAAGTGGTHAATMARLLITWPAPANPGSGTTGSFETVIALNRN